MATKDISDEMVCRAVQAARALHFMHYPYDLLQKWTKEPYKVCLRAMERAQSRKFIECGSSLATAWLTPAGRKLIDNLKKQLT